MPTFGGVINSSDYSTIATNFATARTKLQETDTYIFDNVYRVVLLNLVYPTADLFDAMWTTYLLNAGTSNIPTRYIDAVKALQKHVISRGGYDSINDYYDAEAITVPTAFAEISAKAGFVIDPAYIA